MESADSHSADLPNRIVIVGGGSAGWMAAAYLCKNLPDSCEIVQIESPRVSTIGVGEGTIPSIRDFIADLGVTGTDWIKECQATFKLGIRFDNWLEKGSHWWHPFFFKHPQYPEKTIVDSWLALRQRNCEQFEDPTSLRRACMSFQVAKDNRCPAFLDSFGSYESWNSDHAYHFDASKFGCYLKEQIALPGGVTSIVDHVTHVHVQDGKIDAVETENTGRIDGDFFIDCTGFRRLLIGSISDAEFESYEDELFCDRAVTVAVPYTDRSAELRSYTVSTALSSGWVWQIGLNHRIGSGYVYSSKHLDDNEAERELRTFVGEENVADVSANRIRFQAGHLKRPFVGNCVATGLAEGFIEPLEATSLAITQRNIVETARILKSWSEQSIADKIVQYNHAAGRIYDEIKQFLVSHYCLTRRNDTAFWRDVAQLPSPLHEIRKENLATIPPERVGTSVFATQSWVCLAAGMDCLPTGKPGNIPHPALTLNEIILAQHSQQRVLGGFLPQVTYLEHLHKTD